MWASVAPLNCNRSHFHIVEACCLSLSGDKTSNATLCLERVSLHDHLDTLLETMWWLRCACVAETALIFFWPWLDSDWWWVLLGFTTVNSFGWLWAVSANHSVLQTITWHHSELRVTGTSFESRITAKLCWAMSWLIEVRRWRRLPVFLFTGLVGCDRLTLEWIDIIAHWCDRHCLHAEEWISLLVRLHSCCGWACVCVCHSQSGLRFGLNTAALETDRTAAAYPT